MVKGRERKGVICCLLWKTNKPTGPARWRRRAPFEKEGTGNNKEKENQKKVTGALGWIKKSRRSPSAPQRVNKHNRLSFELLIHTLILPQPQSGVEINRKNLRMQFWGANQNAARGLQFFWETKVAEHSRQLIWCLFCVCVCVCKSKWNAKQNAS